MKTKKYHIAISLLMPLLVLPAVMAQSTEMIKHSIPVEIEKYNGAVFHKTTKYFDGLERPVQNIDVGASAQNGRDIVSFVEYDDMGRSDVISYLPYVVSSAGNNGMKIADPVTQQRSFWQSFLPAGDPDKDYAYAQKQYDDSPLGVVLKQGGVGISKNLNTGKSINYRYTKNTASEIKDFRVGNDGTLIYKGFHPANTLTVRRTYTGEGTDAEDSDKYEYVNPLGQVIASEVRISASDRRITYYVYDDFARQRYVLPPIQESQITTVGATYQFNDLKMYSYYMEYDKYGNPVKEWAPGGICTSHIFDIYDRLTLSQNPEMAKTNQWIFCKYDLQGRQVINGFVSIAGTVETISGALQTYMSEALDTRGYETRGTDLHGYTNRCYPTNVIPSQVLNVTYYDDYDWIPATHAFSTADAIDGTTRTANSVAGMTTGTKTKVLGIEADQWLTSVIYYDDDYNPIQTVSDLYPSGIEIVSNRHNFNGQVIQTKVKQVVDGVTYEYNKWLDYDAYGRLLKVRQRITGDPQNEVILAEYSYDDLGRIISKKIHGGKEETRQAYDIVGRNTEAVSPSFSYKIGYDKSLISGVAGRKDDLVSHITWSNDATGEQKAYVFAYDKLKQYLSATYYEKAGSAWTSGPKYKESVGSYDKAGNIVSLQRYDGTGALSHDYAYTYGAGSNGYALSQVSSSPEFLYDANGNLVKDGQTGVQIAYNILGYPQKIFAGTEQISYIYAANGQKLATQTGSSLTYYRNVMVYSRYGDSAEQLLYMLHPEGLVAKEGAAWVYKYFKTDYLGNTRALLAVRNGSLVNEGQNTDYYPYGGAHALSNLQLNKYLFAGKEYQDATVGGNVLGLYDFGARFYHPLHGRWFNLDPERQFANQYSYCLNNPLSFVDPDGRDVYEVDEMGNVTYTKDDSGFDVWKFTFDKLIWEWDSELEEFYVRIGGATMSFPQGILSKYKKAWYLDQDKKDGSKYSTHTFLINGFDNGKKLFEFLVDHSIVEWSHIQVTIAGKEYSYISTSMEQKRERGMGRNYENGLIGKAISRMDHSHDAEKDGAYPSGVNDLVDQRTKKLISPKGEWGDILFAKDVTKHQNAPEKVPSFYIYLRRSNDHYIKYDKDSKEQDFPGFKKRHY